MFANPVENKLIGRQQLQVFTVFNCVQRAYPGVELLFGQLIFKSNQTLLPERTFHQMYPLYFFIVCESRMGSLYLSKKVIHTLMRRY